MADQSSKRTGREVLIFLPNPREHEGQRANLRALAGICEFHKSYFLEVVIEG